MKTIEINGLQIEVCETLKEIKEMILDLFVENKGFIEEGDSLTVVYKNGDQYYLSATEEEGTFKKTGIKDVIIDTEWGWAVYGSYEIVKIDDDMYTVY